MPEVKPLDSHTYRCKGVLLSGKPMAGADVRAVFKSLTADVMLSVH